MKFLKETEIDKIFEYLDNTFDNVSILQAVGILEGFKNGLLNESTEEKE